MEQSKTHFVVPKVKAQGEEKQAKFKGDHLLDYRWFNLYLCAKRRSGKSVLIYNFLRWFCRPNTIVLFFVSTFYQDPIYSEMRSYLDKRRIVYQAKTSIFDEDTGQSHLRSFLETLIDEKKEKEESKEVHTPKSNSIGMIFSKEDAMNVALKHEDNGLWADLHDWNRIQKIESVWDLEKEQRRISKKKKKEEPEYIVILDDLGDELRHKSLTELMKRSRHFRCKTLVSSQNLFDLPSQAINQLTYAIVFKNMPFDKLEKLREKLAFDIPEDVLANLYRDNTKKPYSFILLDILNNQIRSGMRHVVYSADRHH